MRIDAPLMSSRPRLTCLRNFYINIYISRTNNKTNTLQMLQQCLYPISVAKSNIMGMTFLIIREKVNNAEINNLNQTVNEQT